MIILVAGYLIYGLSSLADTPYTLTDTELPCHIVPGTEEIVGAEDITMITDYVALVSSDDREKLIVLKEKDGGGPNLTPDGAIFEVDLSKSPPGVNKLELTGFPADVAFHPHGIYFLKEKNLLFVINHAYGKGGERIEVFEYHKNSDSDLYYQFSLRNDKHFSMGGLNDLVVV